MSSVMRNLHDDDDFAGYLHFCMLWVKTAFMLNIVIESQLEALRRLRDVYFLVYRIIDQSIAGIRVLSLRHYEAFS